MNRKTPKNIKIEIMNKIKDKILNIPLLLQILLGQLIINIISFPIYEYLMEERIVDKISERWIIESLLFAISYTLAECAVIILHIRSLEYQGNKNTTTDDKSQ